jgi:hypothetical protein
MARDEPVISLVDERAQALRLSEELRATGIPEQAMIIVMSGSDRADVIDALVEFGVGHSDAALFADEVCGGATLLAVRASEGERAQVAAIIDRHAPTRPGRPQVVTDAIPGDASTGRAPEVTPMPMGSGSLESRPDPIEGDER